MIIYPAIDLFDGVVVRLHKGDFERVTQYGTDPVAVAESYSEAGAKWLHLVDLDGAKNPQNRQISLIKKIIDSTGLSVQIVATACARDMSPWPMGRSTGRSCLVLPGSAILKATHFTPAGGTMSTRAATPVAA